MINIGIGFSPPFLILAIIVVIGIIILYFVLSEIFRRDKS